jgi:hypothetical protein
LRLYVKALGASPIPGLTLDAPRCTETGGLSSSFVTRLSGGASQRASLLLLQILPVYQSSRLAIWAPRSEILIRHGVVSRRHRRGNYVSRTAGVVLDAILNRAAVGTRMVRAGLGHIIDKSLEKDRELRYQNAAELRTDLQRLARDAAAPPRPAATTRRTALIGAAVLTPLLAAAVGYQYWSPTSRAAFEQYAITQVTNTGVGSTSAISPDGKFIANVQRTDEAESLWLRNVGTGSNTQIAEPGQAALVG